MPTKRSNAIDWAALSKLKKGEAEFFEGANVKNVQPDLWVVSKYSGIKYKAKAVEHQGKKGVMVWRLS